MIFKIITMESKEIYTVVHVDFYNKDINIIGNYYTEKLALESAFEYLYDYDFIKIYEDDEVYENSEDENVDDKDSEDEDIDYIIPEDDYYYVLLKKLNNNNDLVEICKSYGGITNYGDFWDIKVQKNNVS